VDVPEALRGGLRLRTLQSNRVLELERPDEGGVFAFTGRGWAKECGGSGEPAAGGRIVLRNDHTEPVVAVLETTEWDEEAATAAKVTTMHEFRSWFSSEVLAPGRQVGVESVTLLFSDLLGSTAFYERVGDAPAYGQVRRHFDFMLEWIHASRGTLVKTIGDAVMAVFPEPRLGLQAALDIQRHVGSFNKEHAAEAPIVIKMGLHHGPAIAVNSNGLLDYFGRTVNIAARVQAQSEGGDIVVSAAIAADPNVQALLDDRTADVEHFAAQLKGIDDCFALLRICPRSSKRRWPCR
jgi:class 3 adenylate cyclase